MPPPLNQAFPPKPTFTEANIKTLANKVFIVTGASSGVGLELAKILYSKGATVYLAARSVQKIEQAISSINSSIRNPPSGARLEVLQLDLSDLSSIKQCANKFLAHEERLDVLVHNAAVMTPPPGSKNGYDLEMATNCLGPFLLTRLLEPILRKTARSTPDKNSVRIVWVASMIAYGVPDGNIVFDKSTSRPKIHKNNLENYMQSKVGDVFLATEAARKLGEDGILSLSVHPGLMKTELQRHQPAWTGFVMGLVFKPPKFGAYSELFAAVSPAITAADNGAYIIPWGRLGPIPPRIKHDIKSQAQGGSGLAARFWDWCEKETKAYL
ncbi:short-chain alcohol dehydrogenase [Cladophialophora chaetospira]|uniref:Short-chain alcohol dehydrogenase n=1 Tax=Cladophialophora chaetospira TaxID=386627 RepID=A0AA38X230_9EURO|nr:short-chain alcohol dehydrogenase [Cladophialophora chaetospira]